MKNLIDIVVNYMPDEKVIIETANPKWEEEVYKKLVEATELIVKDVLLIAPICKKLVTIYKYIKRTLKVRGEAKGYNSYNLECIAFINRQLLILETRIVNEEM